MKQSLAADPAFREQTLKTYVRDGIILILPEDRLKRRVLLEYMADDLAYDRPYTDLEISFRILDHYDDYAQVLREMIAEGLIKNEQDAYYRQRM